MCKSIYINLEALDSGSLKLYTGKKIYSVFLSIIREVSNDISGKLHDDQGPNQFAVSPLLGKNIENIVEGQNYKFKVTFLENKLYDIFLKKLTNKIIKNENISLEKIRFEIQEIELDKQDYSYLIGQKRMKFRFSTPTSFKSGDDIIMYPEKSFFFKSLLMRYNKYNEDQISQDILEDLHRIQYERLNINLKKVKMKNYFLEGFVGNCTIRIDSRNKSFIEDIAKLIIFASYSGVGRKTSIGLGRLKILK